MKPRSAWGPAALMLILLVAELECLVVTHYGIRTDIRALFHLPVYHILLTFLTLSAISYRLSPQRFRGMSFHLSWPWLMVHLLSYGLISASLEPLWHLLRQAPVLVAAGFWLCMGALLLGSWWLSWCRTRWEPGLWKAQWSWLAVTALASLVAPYLAELTSSWWTSFASLTFLITEFFLQLIYADTVGDVGAKVLGTSRFVIVIEPGCSGYEGMGLMALLMCFYLGIKRELWTGLWLIPFSVGLAWAANVMRLTCLVALGTEVSPELALRGFHSQAGWICFTLLGCGLIGWLERSPPHPDRATAPPPPPVPGLAYLGPQMGVMLATMLAAALTTRFNYLYGLKVLFGGFLLWHWRGQYQPLLERPGRLAGVVGVAVYIAWLGLTAAPAEAPLSPFQILSPALAWAWLAVRFLGSSLIAPLTEELAFRGYLMRRFQDLEFDKLAWNQVRMPALLASSLLFALLHSAWLAGLLAGLAYAWVCRKPGGLANAVAAHAITNACLCVHALTFGRWDLL